MAEVYEKIDIDTLKIINTPPKTENTINRAEIQIDIDTLTSKLKI